MLRATSGEHTISEPAKVETKDMLFIGQASVSHGLVTLTVIILLAAVLGGFALAYPSLERQLGPGAGWPLAVLCLLLLIPFGIGWFLMRGADRRAARTGSSGSVRFAGDRMLVTGPRGRWEIEYDTGKPFEVEAEVLDSWAYNYKPIHHTRRHTRMTTVMLGQDKQSIGLLVLDAVPAGEEVPLFEGQFVTRKVGTFEKHPRQIELTRPEVQVILNRLEIAPPATA